MGRGIGNFQITKEYLLSKISQEAIFSFYTGLDIATIEDCIENGTMISSPYREDIHPSFGFRYNNRGKLKAKDFAGYFHGDCFDAAAYVIREAYKGKFDINDKHCFRFVMQHIAYAFKNIIYGSDTDYRISEQVKVGLCKIKSSKSIIEFTAREWNDDDISYWGQFGITLTMLNTNYIYPVDEFWINRKINPYRKYAYSKKDPCYAYILGRDSGGVYNTKLYFPNRKHGTTRFITNTSCIEGLLGLDYDYYDIIILTKSTKDRLALQCYFERSPIGKRIGFINLGCETYKIRQVEYDFFRSKCPVGNIVSLMDNDRTGIHMAAWLHQNYKIEPLMIPRSYDVKDFAELISKYDDNDIEILVSKSLKMLKQKCKRKKVNELPVLQDLPY